MNAADHPSILQLRSSAGLYGADRMVLALNGSLQHQSARSRLLGIRNYLLEAQPLHEAAISSGQDAALLPCRGRIDPRTVSALSAQIDERDADVLHVHDYKSAFYAWLATRRRRVALVATLHGWVEASQALRLYNTLEIALLRRFDALVVVAEAQVERLLRAGVPRARIHKIDNGIDIPAPSATASPSLRQTLGLGDADYVFGAVARLSPEKNLACLIEAFAAADASDPSFTAPRPSLLIVGDGPERAALQAQAERLGLSARIRFAGTRADMNAVYPLIDCLVLPSLSEGMPLVVLEAMAHAIPVIATAVGDVPRLLAHAEYGRTVPAGDAQALRAALSASANARGLRDERARAFVLAQHSSAAMASKYLDLYRTLRVEGHGRKTA